MDWDDKVPSRSLGFGMFLRGLKTIWGLSYTQHPKLIAGFLGLVLTVGLDTAFAYVIKLTVDILPEAARLGNKRTVLACLLGLLLMKGSSIACHQLLCMRPWLRAIIRLENDWPHQSHVKLLELPAGFHESQSMGKNVAKITKGCDRTVDALVGMFFSLLPGILFWLMNVLLLALIDWRLSLILLIPIPVALTIHGWMFHMALPLWEEWEGKKEQATSHLIQTVLHAPTVQSFVQEQRETDSQLSTRDEMNDLDLVIVMRERPYFIAMGLVLQLGYIGAIGAAAWFIWQGTGTAGTLTYVVATGLVTMQNFWDLINVYRRMLRNMVSIQRLETLMQHPNDLPDNPEAPRLVHVTGHLAVKDVGYLYPGKDRALFSGLSLDIPAGAMVAFVGKSGSGKSTLVKLLLRAYDVTQGAITLDGKNVQQIRRGWYRRLFAAVRQDVEIFDGSVRDNIAYGHPKATQEEVEKAARAAHLGAILDEVERFPQGLGTIVGERGVRLSGGERQRVGIARAYLHLLKGARFLVLDEATSSLDSQAEQAIQHMVEVLRRERQITVIAIAHRLATVKNADKIFVLQDGHIHEQGTHQQLLRQQGIYAELVRLQELNGSPLSLRQTTCFSACGFFVQKSLLCPFIAGR